MPSATDKNLSKVETTLAAGGLRIAHRGFRACFPENTMCAFAAALGRCDMIELDVQLSQDGMVVVFHDTLLTRTSNAQQMAAGLGLLSLELQQWTWARLKQLDVGTWFCAADPFGTLASGRMDRTWLQALLRREPQHPPLLTEVLTWAMRHDLSLNIELKDMGNEQLNRQLTSSVLEEIVAAQATGSVLLSSFHHPNLRLSRTLLPQLATAALKEGEHPPDVVNYLRTLEVCAYHPEDALADDPLIHEVRQAGFFVNVFTVNEPTRQQHLFAAGATGCFTDDLGQ